MAPALLFALALFAADPGLDTAGSTGTVATPGEPQGDYEVVAWCYGALSAHMALHDEAMPEVERIERTFETHPGAAKEELAFYAKQHKEGEKQLVLFRRAMTAAEKASIRPIQQEGATAIAQGRAVWAGSATADKRRLAQEWMSWALPDRCTPTAQSLEQKASVLGAALSYNADDQQPAAAPAEGSPDEAAAPPAEDGSAEEPAAPAEEPAATPPEEAAPATEAPPADAPVADAPAADAPVSDAPVADAPVADAPVADAPVADAPAADAPVADAPVDAAPATEAPPSIDDIISGDQPAADETDDDDAQNPPAP